MLHTHIMMGGTRTLRLWKRPKEGPLFLSLSSSLHSPHLSRSVSTCSRRGAGSLWLSWSPCLRTHACHAATAPSHPRLVDGRTVSQSNGHSPPPTPRHPYRHACTFIPQYVLVHKYAYRQKREAEPDVLDYLPRHVCTTVLFSQERQCSCPTCLSQVAE